MKFRTLPTGISPATANKIVQVLNVWETGSKEGNYGAYVTYADFTYKGNNYRQITYGKSQTTEFGNLKKLLQMYINNDGTYKDELAPYIDRIGVIENGNPKSLWQDKNLKKILVDAGNNDEIMKATQDVFFDNYYFQPAVAWFIHYGFTKPLSLLVIYDSFIHSGQIFPFLRQKFSAYPPSMEGGSEVDWITQYTQTRHDWLKNHSKDVVQKSKYRTQKLLELIQDNNWNLDKPFKTQGVQF